MNLQDRFDELRSIDAQNPAAWPDWVRIAAAILAGVLVIAAGTWFFIKPKTEEIELARAQEVKLRRDFETKQRKVAALDAYKEQLAEMERSFGDMLRQLPSKAEVANLLNDIAQTRVAAGLEEELFQPQSEITKEFYAEIPNRILVVGDYNEMGNFVSGVAALPRIVTIENVEIRPANARGSNAPKNSPANSGDLRMTATAKTYRYLDEAEIQAQQAAAKPRGGRR